MYNHEIIPPQRLGMKLFLFITLFSLSLFGAHIDEFAQNMGYERDYAKALAKAKKESKPLMLVVVGDTCPWCRKFERKTLSQQRIAFDVAQNFIPLIIDRKHDEGTYPALYNAPRIPTVYFIDPKEEKYFYESMGYVKLNDYANLLNEIKTTFAKEHK